jgi:hypothetical protein
LFIPFEVFLLIVEFLSIATLVKLWYAVPCLREGICQMPVVRTIQPRAEFKKAFEGLLNARSARLFTLSAIRSSHKSAADMLCRIS